MDQLLEVRTILSNLLELFISWNLCRQVQNAVASGLATDTIKRYDQDKDGKISYDEYKTLHDDL